MISTPTLDWGYSRLGATHAYPFAHMGSGGTVVHVYSHLEYLSGKNTNRIARWDTNHQLRGGSPEQANKIITTVVAAIISASSSGAATATPFCE